LSDSQRVLERWQVEIPLMSDLGAVRAAFIDVGQGDTSVLWSPSYGEAIVIDCVNPVPVWDLLKQEEIHRVSALVITHLHADHHGGVVSFLEGCQARGIQCGCVYFYWIPQVTRIEDLLDDSDGHSQGGEEDGRLYSKKRQSSYQTLVDWFSRPENHSRYREPSHLGEANIAGVELEMLHPVPAQIARLAQSGHLNNLSVVLRASGSGSRVLLTGDLEPFGWDMMLANVGDVSGDVLKFPHHGAWLRDDVDHLLDCVGPRVVVISVGTSGDRYDHPGDNVLSALKRRPRIRVLCTQATRKCTADPERAEECIRGLIANDGPDDAPHCSSAGCPCASTVIVQLGNAPEVLHPSAEYHCKIIGECLAQAQCGGVRDLDHPDCKAGV
jgi:beta-lactamase superfamily II metal-dependent hydrolase